MQKILLYGIWGVYNYGCEAIVRGTVNNLKQIYPDAKLYYASFNIEDDKRRLEGCDVEVVTRPFRNNIFLRGIRKILSYVKIDFPVYIDSFKIIDDYDIIVSIGGDMYTISSDGYYPYSLMKFGDIAIDKGKKYVIWGGSIGPFESRPKILAKFQKHLNNITLIVSREYETIDYLKKIDVKTPVIFSPDPAFSVESSKNNKTSIPNKTLIDQLTIGINLSPLSSRYFTENIENAINSQAKTIEEIIQKLNCRIILLPHVLSENINDDDYRYLKKVKEQIKKKFSNKISMVENDPGFIGIKDELVKCDVVIAARMHCAVNAVTCHVPTIFLSYSKKSVGMSNLVYGNNKFIVSIDEFNQFQLVINKIEEVLKIDRLDFISRVNDLKDSQSSIDEIKKILKE